MTTPRRPLGRRLALLAFIALLVALGRGQTSHAADTDILINEIHINPLGDTEFSEFVEIYNAGGTAVDLSGWSFTSGLTYIFPPATTLNPGAYYVIAETDPAGAFTISFQAKFGFPPDGVFTGKLANEGERLILRNSTGAIIDDLTYGAGFPWPLTGGGASLELIHPSFDNTIPGHWRSSAGNPTPKAQNSVFALNAPPSISEVTHSPLAPTSADAVTITARVADLDGVASVILKLQLVEPGSYIALTDPAYASSWADVPMTHQGGGVWAAVLPPSYQVHRRLIRYRITAQDQLANTITVPYNDDTQPNFAYFVYDGLPDWSGAAKPGDAGPLGTVITYTFNTLQDVPVYHLVTKASDTADATFHPPSTRTSGYTGEDYLWKGTLIYNGVVYDHISYRARGGVWRYAMGKNMWKFDFNRGHDFQAYDDYGRPYATPWRKLNFSSVIQQGDFLHRGEQGLFESVGFQLFNLAGVEAPYTSFAHFRIIDGAAETGPTQYDGDFWGLYLTIEQWDGRLLQEHGLPDGNLYKMESWTGELNNQGATAATNKSDLNAFINGYGPNQTTVGPQQNNETWWRTNLDMERYYSYRAIADAIHHYDIGAGKNYFYYLNPETNQWSVMPWDLDLTWANNMYIAWNPPTPPNCGVTIGGDPFHQRTIYNTNIPAFNIEYQNRLREIMDLLYNPEQTGYMIDEQMAKIYTAGQPSLVDVDRARWDYNPVLIAVTANGYLRNYVNLSKAGHGRYYQQPAGTVNDNFPGMANLMRAYVTNRTTWLNTCLLTGTAQVPTKPVLSYTGTAGYPVNQLAFAASPYSDPQSNPFAAMEWRIGRIRTPGVPDFDPTQPWLYEATAVWESGELTSYNPNLTFPAGVLQAGETYRARVRYKDSTGRWSNWSAPVEFTAGTAVPFPANSLIISEILYNPPGVDDISYEFLELKNAYTATLDLTAVTVNGLGNVTFPTGTSLAPQEFILLAKNPIAFQNQFGFAPYNNIGYSGSLSNSGERITLYDSVGITITTVLYSASAPWPTVPNLGMGYSLVPTNPNLAPDTFGGWRTSTSLGGSPGKDDPTITVTGTAATEQDSNSTAHVQVSLSAATGQGITTTLSFTTVPDSALAGEDYLSTAGTLVITQTPTVQLPLTIVGDTRYELSEGLTMQFSGNAGLLANSAAITIADNDPQPSASVADVLVDEGAGTAVFTVTLSAISGVSATVDYATADESALAGEDYQPISGTLTFAPSQTVQTIAVPLEEDALYELVEAFQLVLSNPSHATLGQATAVAQIVDNEPLPILNALDLLVSEGAISHTINITVQLAAVSSVTATVEFATADGTASAGQHYQPISGTLIFAPFQTVQTVPVVILGNEVNEPHRSFALQLANPIHAVIGTGQAIITILDDDGEPEIHLIPAVGVVEGATAVLTVTLVPTSGQTVMVDYATADGSAGTADYTPISGTLVFTPGQTIQTVAIPTTDDALAENEEQLTLTLSNATHGVIISGTAVITLHDNDSPPTISLPATLSAWEGQTGTSYLTVTVSLSAPSGQTVAVDYATAAGSAVAGEDYTAVSGTLVFTPLQTSQTILVPIHGDTLHESDEAFVLTLSNPSNGSLGTAEAALTIANDDAAPQLLFSDVSVDEGDVAQTVWVTVSLSAASGVTATVDWATGDETAVSGTDYLPLSGTLTFTPGQTSQTIALTIVGDTLPEETESLLLLFTNPNHLTLVSTSLRVTIADDDAVLPASQLFLPLVVR